MTTLHGRSRISLAPRARLWAGLALLFLPLSPAVLQGQAEEETTDPWVRTLILRASYADYDGGPGVGQSALLYLSKPDFYWIFSAGHRRLFDSEGYGLGVTYRHELEHVRLGAGLSSGYNQDGYLYPKWHAGLSVGTNVAPGVPVDLSWSRRRSAGDESHTDRFGLGARWWTPGPWLLGANVVYSMRDPGDTHAWSGGGSVTYMLWRRLHVGVDVDYGDGAYMLFPSQHVVDFRTWSYGATVTKFLNPDVGLSLKVDYTDYYGGTSFSLGYSRRW